MSQLNNSLPGALLKAAALAAIKHFLVDRKPAPQAQSSRAADAQAAVSPNTHLSMALQHMRGLTNTTLRGGY